MFLILFSKNKPSKAEQYVDAEKFLNATNMVRYTKHYNTIGRIFLKKNFN